MRVRWPRPASIRARLLLSLLPLFVLAELLIGTITYRYVLRESGALFDYHLEQMALSLRDQGAVQVPPMPAEERERKREAWRTAVRRLRS